MKAIFQISGSVVLLLSFVLSMPIAAGVVVVGHPDNTNVLTGTQIRYIYLGKYKTFPNGDDVTFYDLPEGDKNRDEFRKKLLQKSQNSLSRYWARMLFSSKGRPPEVLSNADMIKQAIASNPHAIAYMDEGDVDMKVKVLMAVQ